MDPELQDLVDEVSRLLRAPATLEDRSFHLVAFGSHDTAFDAVRGTSILRRESTEQIRAWFERFGIATSEGPVRTPGNAELGILPRVCLPARSAGVTHGYLWVLDDAAGHDARTLAAVMALAGRAGRVLARAAREQRTREQRLADLFGADRVAASQAAAELHDSGLLDPGEPVVVAALRSPVEPEHAREPVHVRLGVLPGSVLVTPLRGHTPQLLAMRGGDARDGLGPAREAVLAVLADSPGAVAGVAAPRRDLAEAHASWAEARLAARVAALVPSRAPVAHWADLGAYRLLGAAPEPALVDAVLDDGVRALLDAADGRLAATAACYLDLAGSAQATAAALRIHRQTLYYRLQQVERVTGLDLSRGQDRLRLHLALVLGPLVRPASRVRGAEGPGAVS